MSELSWRAELLRCDQVSCVGEDSLALEIVSSVGFSRKKEKEDLKFQITRVMSIVFVPTEIRQLFLTPLSHFPSIFHFAEKKVQECSNEIFFVENFFSQEKVYSNFDSIRVVWETFNPKSLPFLTTKILVYILCLSFPFLPFPSFLHLPTPFFINSWSLDIFSFFFQRHTETHPKVQITNDLFNLSQPQQKSGEPCCFCAFPVSYHHHCW